MISELAAEDIRAHTAALQDFREVVRKRLAERPEKDSANYRFRDTLYNVLLDHRICEHCDDHNQHTPARHGQ